MVRCWRGLRLAKRDGRFVAPRGKLDQDAILAALLRIVVLQLLAQPARFVAHDGLEARIERGGLLEDVQPNGVFVDAVAPIGERALDQVSEELASS